MSGLTISDVGELAVLCSKGQVTKDLVIRAAHSAAPIAPEIAKADVSVRLGFSI
jgi:hypothetical protein